MHGVYGKLFSLMLLLEYICKVVGWVTNGHLQTWQKLKSAIVLFSTCDMNG